ncbi:chondroitin sulfate synthase 1 [Lepeophtheirus salmonis]|uniref:Hexosyltransferase n=1 Tax=Lepeophtheirus salmonis TaxID=72036 RepID=A0A0K2T7R1_LEPSM|nr:chondroitin sulfate synthase 1-like [Lepeophtheirus salmonis]XP_040563990.1 chondroitin sulfate synthase 1-like [Lepeophtheirus salmonis]
MIQILRRHRKMVYEFLLGLILGQIIYMSTLSPTLHLQAQKNTLRPSQPKKLLRIGIMTAEKYIDSRACAAYRTWTMYFNHSFSFYVGKNVPNPCNLPLVQLPVDDNIYPPQKKSFYMLQHLYEHHVEDYEWFMRVDDDVYVNGDKLQSLLRQLDSNLPLYLGQAGLGNQEEKGHIHLDNDENYCMGGPGVILSHVTLRKLNGHKVIETCLSNLLTSHEDIEVGRCILKFVGIPCTWSYQMQSLFFHLSGPKGESSLITRSKDTSFLRNTITFHPLKTVSNLYDLHERVRLANHKDIVKEMISIHSELSLKDDANHGLILPKLSSLYSSNLSRWTFVRKKVFYSELPISFTNDKLGIDLGRLTSLIESSMKAKASDRYVQFRDINYGYIQEPSESGVNYILDLLFIYKIKKKEHHTKRKIKDARVRRHIYCQTPFLPFQISNEIYNRRKKEKIHFILPLAGREEQFNKFITCFEDVVLKESESVKLIVVYFISDTESQRILSRIQDKFMDLEKTYSYFDRVLVTLNRVFSRAVGLDIGTNLCRDFDLMLFMDVDIRFTSEALSNARILTELNTRVYFPIIKSNFKDTGAYWRYYGYGMVAVYKGDYDKVKFDKTIVGWGKEDGDLHRRFLRFTKFEIIRTPDPSLTHIYHDVTCSKDLASDQKRMCETSRINNYLSYEGLSKFHKKIPNVF